jgi:hypothetical protein
MFVKAEGFWLKVLDLLGCDGLTMPWRTVYIRPACWHDKGLWAHEFVHLAQIDRMGPIWFSIRYLYELARYGYRDMPMEIEAREAQKYHDDWHAAYDKKRAALRL